MSKLNIYNRLCESRKGLNRKKGDGNYYELHHIVPRWMGGKDDADNLVLLTAREHYLAHYLLFLHYRDRSSAAAFHIMNESCNSNNVDSKKYAEVREWQSKNLRGENNPAKRPEARQKISNAVSGEKNGMYGRTGETNPFYGKTHSEEFKAYKRKLHGRALVFQGETYDSIRDAERKSGVSRFKIKKNCVFL
jgi:hypothetical protein